MANPVYVTFFTAAAGALGYCIYFDYQRRHNPQFRKSIYLKKRQAEKAEKLKTEASKLEKTQLLKKKLAESLLTNPLSAENKEQTFIEEVTRAEKLSAIVGKEIDAAIHFYRALSVYPDPTAILEIYQKSVPAEIYELIMLLTAIFPPANITSLLSESTGSVLETE
jgi:import receptor subunit TOM20